MAATYAAGREWFGKRAGLVAAAIMAVAFLPVFYSRLALNDPSVGPGLEDRVKAALRTLLRE